MVEWNKQGDMAFGVLKRTDNLFSRKREKIKVKQTVAQTRNLDAPEKEPFPATSSLSWKWSSVFICTRCSGKPVGCLFTKPLLGKEAKSARTGVSSRGESSTSRDRIFLFVKIYLWKMEEVITGTDFWALKIQWRNFLNRSLSCCTCLLAALPLLLRTAINFYLPFHSLIQSLNIHWFSALSQVCYFRLCRKWKNGTLGWDTLGTQRLGHLPLLKYYLWFYNSKSL